MTKFFSVGDVIKIGEMDDEFVVLEARTYEASAYNDRWTDCGYLLGRLSWATAVPVIVETKSISTHDLTNGWVWKGKVDVEKKYVILGRD